MKRIATGIIGLDDIIEGGMLDKSSMVVIGSSGTGKSTFVLRYLLYGLEKGENGLYISLEEDPKQIIRNAKLMGFKRIEKYLDKSLFFFKTRGEDFQKIMKEQLPKIVEASKRYKVPTRVVIDPLTPLIWAEREPAVQRGLITDLFGMFKEVGPIVSTVEEHKSPGETIGEDVLIPVYLSDAAVHLQYDATGGPFSRRLTIVKFRGTRHGEEIYPYMFVRGVGVVVKTTPVYNPNESNGYDEVFDKAIKIAKSQSTEAHIIWELEEMKGNWNYDFSPKEVLELIFKTYSIGT